MEIFLLTAPYDSGHHKQRLGLGPLSLIQGLEYQLRNEGHTVRKSEIFVNTPFATEVTTSFEIIRMIALEVREATKKGMFPILLTGNCNSASIGALSGLQNGAGVVWFDCHGDYNTPETTVGGFLDGMALSMVAGHCWTQLTASVPGFTPVPENKIILAGARDFDPLEAQRLRQSAITLVSPEMIRRNDQGLTEKLIPMDPVYLHVDLDVLDPRHVKASSYSTAGGLSPAELYYVIDLIKNRYSISALSFTAYDPTCDPDGKVQDVVNTIAEIVV